MALSENEKRRFENRYRGIVDQKSDPFDALPDSVKARLYKRKSTLEKNAGDVPASKRKHIYSEFGTGVETEFRNNLPGLAQEYARKRAERERTLPLIGAGVYEAMTGNNMPSLALEYAQERAAQGYKRPSLKDTDFRNKVLENAFTGLQLSQMAMKGSPSAKDTAAEYMATKDSQSKRKPYTLRNTPYDQDLAVYTPPEVEEKRRREKFENVGFYDQNDEFVRYDGLERQSDFPEMVKSGKEKDNVFNANYGLIDYLNKDKRDVMKAANTNFTYMTDTEKDLYYYLNAKYGAKAASNYVESINKELNRRSAEYATAQAQKLGKEHPILGTVADTAFATVGSGAYPWIVAKTVAGKKEIDPNDPAFGADILNSGIRSGMSENETLKTLIPNEGARNFAIGTGLSMAENIGRLPMGYLGLGVAAGGAGLSATREATERGGTANQAIAYGAANAAAEAFFEKFSLENLKSLKAAPGKGVRIFLRNIGKQALTEGSEEVFTEIANTVSDQVIMRELSNYNLELEYYKSQGMSEEEAKQKAFGTFLSNVALAGAGGAISGGLMGGGGQIIGNYELSQYGKSIDQDYREYAQGIDTSRESYTTDEDHQKAVELQQLAEEYATRQANKEMISNRDKAEYEIALENFQNDVIQHMPESESTENAPDQETTGAITAREATAPQNQPEQPKARETAPVAEKLDNVAYNAPEPNASAVREWSKPFGTEGKTTFEALYDGETDLGAYYRAFGRAYNIGRYNMEPTPQQRAEAAVLLGVDGFSTAYAAGARDRNAEIKYDKDTYEPTALIKGAPKEGGLGYVAPGATESQKRWAMSVGKATGLQVDLVDTLENPNAAASYTKGKITLSINSSDFLGSASHELTHYIKDYSPELYQRYKDETIKALMEAKGVDLETLLSNYGAVYERSGQQLSRDELTDEIVADAAQSFFNDPEYINKIVSNNTIVGKKIVDWLTDVIDAIKQLIKTGSTRQAAKALEENLENLETARDIWMDALERAGDRYKAGWETDTDTKYQLNQFGLEELAENLKDSIQNDEKNIICNTQEDIKKFAENINPSKLQRIYLGSVGKELGDRIKEKSGVDITGYSIVIRSDNIAKIFKDHGTNKEYKRGQIPVTADDIAMIPRIISEADYIERTQDTDGGKPAIRFEKTIKGKNVIIEYVSDKRKILYTQTMWINKKNPATTEDVQAPSLTPETVSGSDSNNSISQDTNGGKSLFQLEDVDNVDVRALQQENQTLREANELLRRELELTGKTEPRLSDVKKVATELLRQHNSDYRHETLTRNLIGLYEYLRGADQVDMVQAAELAASIAKGVLKKAKSTSEYAQQYEDLRQQIRDTKIQITDQDKADLMRMGGYNNFRKQYFGKMKLGNDGISIDAFYQELADQHPELFDANVTHPADQLMAVATAIDTMTAQVANPYGADMDEMSYIVGQEILQAYSRVREVPATFADKKAAEIQQVRRDYNKKMSEYKNDLKKKYDQALKQVWRENSAKIDELAKEYRELKDARMVDRAEYRTKMDRLRNDKNLALAAMQQRHREQLQQRRDSLRAREAKKRIIKDTREMHRWLTEPNDKKHVPESLRTPVAQFLLSIDFSSDWTDQNGGPAQRTIIWKDMSKQLNSIVEAGGIVEEQGEQRILNVDPSLPGKINELADKVKLLPRLEELDANQLERLQESVTAMKKLIQDANQMISNANYRSVETAATSFLSDVSKKKDAVEFSENSYVGKGKNMFQNDLLDSNSAFYRMGPVMRSIYQEIRDAEDRHTANLVTMERYFRDTCQELGITKEELREWTGPKAKQMTFIVDGKAVKMTAAQLMTLYELDKRGQAKKHIYSKGGGIIPAELIQQKDSDNGKTKTSVLGRMNPKPKPVRVTEQDVQRITSVLTPKQIAFADKLQFFLGHVTSEWGNETSMKMYGYKKFTAQNYFPIEVYDNAIHKDTVDVGMNALASIKNIGAAKATSEKAGNALVLNDIMDVYIKHSNQMSIYNAMLAPLSDFQKVYNYKSGEAGNVKEEIERAWGKGGAKYLDTLIKDINGRVDNPDPGMYGKLMQNMKAAAVAGNLRVAIQQPTAMVRAAAELSLMDLGKGAVTKSPTLSRKEQWAVMCKYAPITQWKDWGFFKMDVSRSMRDVLMGPESKKQSFVDKTMWLAAKGDEWAWRRMWNACEYEVMRSNPELEPGSDAYYRKVGSRFSTVIDKTQVVDSVLHRTQIMRNSDGLVKMSVAFMNEPLKSYNMLYRAFVDARESGNYKAVRTAAVIYAANAITTALAASLVDMWRDDDKDKKLWEKYLNALMGNAIDGLNPLNMIPLVKDIWSIFQGYSTKRTDLSGIEDIQKVTGKWLQYFQGDSKYTIPYLIMETMDSTSIITGVPVRNLNRDIIKPLIRSLYSVWDGDEYRALKLKYDIGSEKNLGYYADMMVDAMIEGDQTRMEQIKADMLEAGLENEDISSRYDSEYRKYLKDNVPEIEEAAQARIDGKPEEYKRLYDEIVVAGYDPTYVKKAIDTAMNKLKSDIEEAAQARIDGKEKKYKRLYGDLIEDGYDPTYVKKAIDTATNKPRSGTEESEEKIEETKEEEPKAESIYSTYDLLAGVEQVSNTTQSLKAFSVVAEDMYQAKLSNGKKKSEAIGEIKSLITKAYKKQWIEAYQRKDKATYQAIQNKLKYLKIGGATIYGSSDWESWLKEAKKNK